MLTLLDPTGSTKGLRLEPWFKAAKEGKLLPPVQACVNPAHGCNLACLCCNLSTSEMVVPPLLMPPGHLIKVVDMLAQWGVKSVMFGAVGEPTLHRELAEAIIVARMGGLDVSVTTNGVHMGEDLLDAVSGLCSTIWFKIPAATVGTYELVTRRRLYNTVTKTFEALERRRGDNPLLMGWLYEMTTLNFDEVKEACLTARVKGFDMLNARPLGAGAYGKRGDAEEMTNGLMGEALETVIEACKETGDTGFRVNIEYPVPHGGFHQCYAAPLVIHLGADGNVYFCLDQYGNPEQIIGTHHPDPSVVPTQVWGGEAQQQLLTGDTPYWCDAACSLRDYHLMARALVWEERDPLRQWQLIH